jgi:hypothetical protein
MIFLYCYLYGEHAGPSWHGVIAHHLVLLVGEVEQRSKKAQLPAFYRECAAQRSALFHVSVHTVGLYVLVAFVTFAYAISV